MSTVASLSVRLLGDTRNLENSFGKSMKTAGKWAGAMVAAGTMAAGAIGVTAVKAAIDFQKEMANTGTLIGKEGTGRVKELSKSVKNLSKNTGKPLADLAGGMYQVVSAFGDTGDASKQLEIAAKASSAGVASTTDSVNLLSAVTKGYGDTSAKAMQKASDLAFQTVKLGQTSFPELAASMGKVVPIAGSLKVSQEELFGAMATLTGVTGNTAEVSTQLRATLTSMMKPSESMTSALDKMGYANGAAALESLGLEGVLSGLKKQVNGDEIAFANMFGSVEAGTAVLALTGTAADDFAEKTRAMGDAAGATQAAFEIQQATVAASMERIKASLNVVMVELGEKFLPVLEELLEWVTGHMPEIKAIMEQTFDKMLEVMTTAIEKIKAIIEWFQKYKEIIIPAVKTVAAIFIASWIAMAIASVVNSAIMVVSWAKTGLAAIKSAAIQVASGLETVAIWLLMAVDSLKNGAKIVASWVMTGVAAIKNVLIIAAQSAIVVAKWVWMGVQSTIQAGKMAAAWFIALGPVGWVITVIAGLVILIIKYWDDIVKATVKAWGKIKKFFVSLWEDIKANFGSAVEWIRGKVNNILSFFKGLPGRIRSRVRGMFDGLKDAFRGAVNWIISKWNRLQLKIGGQRISLPFGQSFSIPSVTLRTPNIPRFAKGVKNFEGGTALVGEGGPELVNLPKGSDVHSNPATRDMLKGDIGIHIENLIVREEADIEKIAQKLFTLQQNKSAALGR